MRRYFSINRQVRSGLMVILLGAMAGCAVPVKEQPRAGFISDYSSLEQESENAYAYASESLGEYQQFLIEPLEILIEQSDTEEEAAFSDEELESLQVYFAEQLRSALTRDDGYEVVEEAGDGVARVRHGLTALDASTGALNISIFTKLTGAGLGGAAMEGEVVDSLTGQQLSAAVQWGNGSRVLAAGITKLGDAKGQIKRWAKDLRKRIDDAHNKDTDDQSEAGGP